MPADTFQNVVLDLDFDAAGTYSDPYNEVELDVVFNGPNAESFIVPAFWDGGRLWKARFAASAVGDWTYETRCSNAADSGLHGRTGSISVSEYTGDNLLLRRGRLRVAPNKRSFQYADGSPFLWLGDTWWMGLTTRLDWPASFRALAADRLAKGFNVVQIVAGPYPDMDAWDPRGRNEAGFPFTDDFRSINPSYYQHADTKLAYLADAGLVPCIVGMWGYYLPQLGVERTKRFWRYLVARYGAYPVVWCMAGEGAMSWYLSKTKDADAETQKKGWTEVMAYVRGIDGYHNLITIHPTRFGRDQVVDDAYMDFEMLQTGHNGISSVATTIESLRKATAREPRMPVITSEVNYEGILGRSWHDIQRLCVYHSIFNGSAGHTYGANGIWQVNGDTEPYGPSPHGRTWGNTPWREAAQLPGSRHVGIAGRFVQQYLWNQFERRNDWIPEPKDPDDPYAPYAVGIPRQLRIAYFPNCWDTRRIENIEPDVAYHAHWFDTMTGNIIDIGDVKPDSNNGWHPPFPPEVRDWILVMAAQ